MKNVQDIRNHVRNYLSLTSQDMGDGLIDTWIAEGDRRCARKIKTLPYFETSVTLTTVGGQSEYDIPTATVNGLPATLKDVLQVSGPRGPLSMWDASEAEAKFFTITPLQRWPQGFSLWGNKIRFWPTPDQAYTFTIRGYRSRTNWMSAGASAIPDLPEDFHTVVQEWALHKGFEHQDDYFRGQSSRQAFEESLTELIADEQAAPPATPIILNGRHRRRDLDQRMLYPWE